MNIVVYTKDNCSFCNNAKALLISKGIPFSEKKLSVDFTREFLLETYPNARTFPVVVVDGFHIGGFSELQETLNQIPKTSLLLEG